MTITKTNTSIGIIDYGVGNLGSVMGAFEVLNINAQLISEPSDIKNSDRLILPGVGSFYECKKLLDRGGWTAELQDVVLKKRKPILGICLGMQLLAEYGYEGVDGEDPVPGLGLLEGEVVSLKKLGCLQRVPHVGWNSVNINGGEMFQGVPDGTDFYFVHSCVFVPKGENYVNAMLNYGGYFTASFEKKYIWGTQFHPEKSSRAGFKVLQNFSHFVNNAQD